MVKFCTDVCTLLKKWRFYHFIFFRKFPKKEIPHFTTVAVYKEKLKLCKFFPKFLTGCPFRQGYPCNRFLTPYDRYQDDRDTALLEIIQFFISASGCKSTVTPQLYRGIGSGFQEVLKTMTDEFGEEGSEYPLTLTGANFKRFKPGLGDFITQLVKQCAQGMVVLFLVTPCNILLKGVYFFFRKIFDFFLI